MGRAANLEIVSAANLKSSWVLLLANIEDPRVEGRTVHGLFDLLVISLCAVVCGCENFAEMERFAYAKEKWFRKFLDLDSGIPSHDTFRRVLSYVDPEAFEDAFFQWTKKLRSGLKKKQRLCLDGKSVKGTERSINKGRQALHLVNVYSSEEDLVLGQKPAKQAGFAEMAAIEECLKVLDVNGCLISIDAASTYPKILRLIRKKDGDYIGPIKKNQRLLYPCLAEIFAKIPEKPRGAKNYTSTSEKNRGRVEKRQCTVLSLSSLSIGQIKIVKAHEKDVKTVIRITRKRREKDTRFSHTPGDGEKGRALVKNKNYQSRNLSRTSLETTYYITNLKITAIDALRRVREHWRVENNLHWVLDVSFKEDDCRVRDKKTARNLALFRKMAFNLLKKEKSPMAMKSKIKKAGWDETYLEKVVFETS